MFTSGKTRTARAAIIVLGLAAALAATTAQGAVAQPSNDDPGGSVSTTSTAAAGPTTAPPIPATPTPPDPATCDATPPAPPADPGTGVHKGVIITPGGGAAQPNCDNTTTTGTGTQAAPPASGLPAPPTSDGSPQTSAPPAPGTDPQAPTTGDATAPADPVPPVGPVVHNGVVFPPSTEAPKPTAAAPTAALSSIATATVIRSRSVSTIVTVPAGLPVTDPTEISILFGLSGSSRQTQTYNPAAGNRFVFNFDAGDATARTEDVAVSLADRAVAGAHFGFVAKVPVEALYDATLSPLTFTLTNDCDFDFAGLIAQDSEPVIH